MKIKAFLALLVSLCILLPAFAQTKPSTPSRSNKTKDDQDDVVRITTNLVQVDVVVTKDGKPVKNLTADDFEIFQDGKQQTITNFAYISNVSDVPEPRVAKKDKLFIPPGGGPIKPEVPPRTVAFVVDDLGLSFESINRVRPQLRKFIAERLHPDDLVAVIRVSGEMGVLQQFTTDRRLLDRAVDQLRWNSCSRMGIHLFEPSSGLPFQSLLREANPCLRDSVFKSMRALRFLVDAMGELPGRKAMVVFSDSMPGSLVETGSAASFPIRGLQNSDGPSSAESGFPYGTDYAQLYYNVAEMAIRSSVVIYSVDTQGLATTGITAADTFAGDARSVQNKMNSLLSQRSQSVFARRKGGNILAKQTGGFQIRNSNSFDLDRIMEDQVGYYLLGYRPSSETFDRRFHQIKAKVKRSGLTVRTRTGFVGVKEEEVIQMKRGRQSMNLAAASPFGPQDIEIGLASYFANSQNEGSVIRTLLHLNTGDLTFERVNDRHEATIHLYGVIFGDNGSVLEEVTRRASLSLSPQGYEHALRDGLRLRLDIGVKRPGSYQMRVAARDEATARMGSAGQFVEVPDLKSKRLAMSGVVLRTVAEGFDGANESQDAMTSPARRRFSSESDLFFGSVIYNAVLDPSSGKPNLTMEAKLFRDAKNIYSSPEMIVDLTNQPDLARVFTNGRIQVNSSLGPGHYYLQVSITDKLAKKNSQVVQWVDFEIVE
jgi:VWFA-related protein